METATEQAGARSVTRLQAEVAQQIMQIVRQEAWPPGAALSDLSLSRRLGVSRTPVRAALKLLQQNGIAHANPGHGYVLAQGGDTIAASNLLPRSQSEEAYQKIREDRALNRLPREVSETELVNRYGVPLSIVRRALVQMASDGIVTKQRGHGWLFAETLDTRESLDESLRFRVVIECAAMLEESFRYVPEQLASMRDMNRRLLASGDIDRAKWLDVNQAFHETLAEWSGNRYFVQAVQQHGRLRRLRAQAFAHEIQVELVHALCREHLAILDAIEDDDQQYASAVLRRHLQASRARVLARHDGYPAAQQQWQE
jgi:DNA-binding GntR family transcriptional regulator